MKKLLILIVLTISVNVFSQETTKVNQVYESVDQVAIYPGGIDAFRNNFYQTFQSGKINGRGKIRSEAIFVIDQKGYITDVEIKGDNKSMNKEMERTIKAMSKTKWSPATIGGEPVKYRFKFPISTNIQ